MELTREDIQRIRDFIDKYYKKYDAEGRDFLKNYVPGNDDCYLDITDQIYTYLFPDRYRSFAYSKFALYLSLKFPELEKSRILEIGSGYIPGLALFLTGALVMKHPITCMDPCSLKIALPDIIDKQMRFTDKTNISKYDLLIAHCPCEALESIVTQAVRTKTEMCVQTCRCNHIYDFKDDLIFNAYINNLMDKLAYLENYGFVVACEYTDEASITRAPVISAVRKRK